MKSKLSRLLAGRDPMHGAEIRSLREDVKRLQADVEECRRLNERLSDVLDLVTELLLPENDRDQQRLAETLRKI